MSTKREGTIHERVVALISDEMAVDEADVTLNADLSIDLGADGRRAVEVLFERGRQTGAAPAMTDGLFLS